MNRYNKVMNKIKITTEMYERIMKNIQETDFEIQSKKVHFFKGYRKYIYIAACLLICVAGILLSPNIINRERGQQIQVVPDILKYNSKSELSSAVGFKVKDVQNIPFDVEDIDYTSYGKKLAEIIYLGNSNSLTFRMSEGSEDISGDYNEYEKVKYYSVDSYSVILKGSNGLYNLVTWKDSSFSYSLQLNVAVSEIDLFYIIESIK